MGGGRGCRAGGNEGREGEWYFSGQRDPEARTMVSTSSNKPWGALSAPPPIHVRRGNVKGCVRGYLGNSGPRSKQSPEKVDSCSLPLLPPYCSVPAHSALHSWTVVQLPICLFVCLSVCFCLLLAYSEESIHIDQLCVILCVWEQLGGVNTSFQGIAPSHLSLAVMAILPSCCCNPASGAFK